MSWSPIIYHVLFKTIQNLRDSHCYADDFKPDELSSQQGAIISMQNCTKDIRLWMEYDKLLLNDEKKEFLIIGTRQQLSKVNISSIIVGNSDVMRSSVVRNLGIFIDDKHGQMRFTILKKMIKNI